jgi:hypothetical protein
MTKYKIVYKDSTKIVNLASLSTKLKVNSEIYSIECEKEILLGIISHKSLVYLSSEFADFVYQNYAKNEDLKIESCINLIRKWIDNSSSVSQKNLFIAARRAANGSHNTKGINAVRCSAYYAASVASTHDANLAETYAADAAVCTADSAAYVGVQEDRLKEFIRQGEFILDYLKSGLYLFHLEK